MRSRSENTVEYDPYNETSQANLVQAQTAGATGITLPSNVPVPGIIALTLTAAGPLNLPAISVAAGNTGAVRMEGRSIKIYNTSGGAFAITMTPAAGDPAIVGTATIAQNASAIVTVINGVWRVG